ncbi:MAG TPA: hypothetical protein VJX16_11015 [Terriglobales bacterium]|nr:hypothetical protein [Terriglobales bacterium]
MKTLVVGLLLFSIPGFRITPSPKKPADPVVAQSQQKGRWYLAESGHAVFCSGPVITVNMGDGGLRKVATYCRGSKPLVPLKD